MLILSFWVFQEVQVVIFRVHFSVQKYRFLGEYPRSGCCPIPTVCQVGMASCMQEPLPWPGVAQPRVAG